MLLNRSNLQLCGFLLLVWLALPKRKGRMRRLRLVQYNVKRFEEYETVAATLERLRPDVVTLNEVFVEKVNITALSSRLGLSDAHFFGHVGGVFGNAILCNGGVVTDEVLLEGGTYVEAARRKIRRGLVVVENPNGFDAIIASAHLDHITEAERATQAKSLIAALDRRSALSSKSSGKDEKLVVLAGDMNSLRRDDYREEDWARLESRNLQRGWTPPDDSSREGGALYEISRGGFVDLARDFDPTKTPEYTCMSHCDDGKNCQRIDYAFGRPPPKVVDVFVDKRANGSDHSPLVLDMELPLA